MSQKKDSRSSVKVWRYRSLGFVSRARMDMKMGVPWVRVDRV